MQENLKSLSQFRVRYQETDMMGIVHHSVYYIWFEAGRTEWMRERGLSYRECEERGWLLPVISTSCEYKQSAYYDDLLELETELVPSSGIKIEFNYIVRNVATGKILATGHTGHVCVDREHKINKKATLELRRLFDTELK